jgi:beta-lactamase superfamily II metal-dependent hydrolase
MSIRSSLAQQTVPATAGLEANGLREAFAEAAQAPAVGQTWPGWEPGEFQVHFIYTGVCESMFYIFPDGTSMLLDCGDHPACNRGELAVPILPDQSRHAGEWIARYVARVNPNQQDVDYMMVSHFHADHTGGETWHAGETSGRGEDYYLSGFAQAAETLHFGTCVDRGWPDYDDPIPLAGPELDNMRKLYAWLQKKGDVRFEKFRVGELDQIAMKRDGARYADAFGIRNVCGNGRIALVDGGIRDLYAGFEGQWLNENAMSLGMVMNYGPFRFFTGGDFSDEAPALQGRPRVEIENELGPQVGPVDVCKINHHGHNSMPEGFVKAVRARVYVGCVWDQLHNLDPVMARLGDPDLYPGERLVCPGIMPAERRAVDSGKPWMATVPPAAYEGGHVVLNVTNGGERYSITYLSAADESMQIRAVHHFETRR